MMKRKRFGAYDMLQEKNEIRKQNIAFNDNERIKTAINSYCGACYKLDINWTEFRCKVYKNKNLRKNLIKIN